MNILILRVSAIGDVIHTLPALFMLKKLYPKAKISWIVQKKAAPLLINHPLLENVWILPDNFLKIKHWQNTYSIIKEIRTIQWDAILDFQGILKTLIFLLFVKGPTYGFDKKNNRSFLNFLLTKNHITPNYTNIIQKNLALVSDITLRKKAKKYLNPEYEHNSPTIDHIKKDFYLNIPEINKNFIDNWLKNNNIEKFIAITPNTTWESKYWPLEYWKSFLTKASDTNNIVLLGKTFGKHAQELYHYAKQNKLNVYAAPESNLIDSAYLINKSELLIAPDTGILHLADFIKAQSIGIFGPTKALQHGPFLNTNNIKNCLQIECPHYYQKQHIDINCMKKLTPTMLLTHVNNILSSKN